MLGLSGSALTVTPCVCSCSPAGGEPIFKGPVRGVQQRDCVGIWALCVVDVTRINVAAAGPSVHSPAVAPHVLPPVAP